MKNVINATNPEMKMCLSCAWDTLYEVIDKLGCGVNDLWKVQEDDYIEWIFRGGVMVERVKTTNN